MVLILINILVRARPNLVLNPICHHLFICQNYAFRYFLIFHFLQWVHYIIRMVFPHHTQVVTLNVIISQVSDLSVVAETENTVVFALL